MDLRASKRAENDAFVAQRADQLRQELATALIRAGAGDKSAFEMVYRRTSAKLFGVCLRIFGDRQEAEDALQDVYITIWNKAARFDAGRASPISWLVKVARNRAIDRLRANGNVRLAPIENARDVADGSPLADVQMLASAEDQALTGCINALDRRDAAFIRSAFLQGATYADLAEREALPLGTVKSRIRRALLKLRDCLGG
jgi:RNA polymerase sigma-70 factor, ECF subfamily